MSNRAAHGATQQGERMGRRPATTRIAAALAALAAATGAGAAEGAPDAPAQVALAGPQQVEIVGNYLNAVGSSDAASQGSVTGALIESRPTLRPAEVLEFVPGVIVTQHSGDGKANQYFLRGFNLDHGTDFATFVAGMPVNMPTHAHGQGYSDLNWLIPELVDRIDYRKGPYFADEGDFSSAGAAHIGLVDKLPRGLASVTLGEHHYERGLFADSVAAGPGQVLGAVELAHNDGPWELPEKFHGASGVLRYSFGDDLTHHAVTAMGYGAGWDATDQIPQRAVASGLVGRFGAIDPTDGGQTSRYSLSYELRHQFAADDAGRGGGEFRLQAWALESQLDLFSDFTYFLDDPVHGDQFEQAEHRRAFGLAASRSWDTTLAGRDTTNTLGVQLRQDRLDPVGLYDTEARTRLSTVQESRVRETSAALYAENAAQWNPWLRSVAGVRVDHYDFDVASSIPANSGRRDAGIVSPKLALVFGPWNKTEYFIDAGSGFHSNDARGTTETVTPKEGLPTTPVTPLARSIGGELGLRTQAVPGLQSSLALWALHLDSELVFSGDAGDTEPSRASQRYGIEWNNHYAASRHVLLDADLAWSHARYTQVDPAGQYIPGAIETVASFGATLKDQGPWFGQFQFRFFGPRPLVEDNSQRSKATSLAYLRAGYRLTPDTKLVLDVFNLFDRKASDIDYYYASRLPGEPAAGVNDIHFHPVEPRSVRLTLSTSF
jgi:outer membrane receptor protein involved in Fe transport